MKNKKIWLVGHLLEFYGMSFEDFIKKYYYKNGNIKKKEDTERWGIVGIYSSEKLARKACTEWYHFVASLPLNESDYKEPHVFYDYYWPYFENLEGWEKE